MIMKQPKSLSHSLTQTAAQQKNSLNPFTPEPTYEFQIGDPVCVGYLQDPVVFDISEDKKIYGIEYTETEMEKDSPIKRKKMYCEWYRVRPRHTLSQTIIQNKVERLSFETRAISGVLYMALSDGVDMNPDYQRDFVWSKEDQQALLDSIFHNIKIGHFVFVERDAIEFTDPAYEILDGKQRLTTLLAFYLNQIPYGDIYYNDLCQKDKHWFEQSAVSVAILRNKSRKEILEQFIALNTTGHTVDKTHIDNVKKLLDSEQ